MPYELRRLVIGEAGRQRIDISADDYAKIEYAKQALLEVLTFEEKFDLLMENYVEFEEAILGQTVRSLAFQDFDYVRFQFPRNLINRRFLNLLSASRLYLDTFNRHAEYVFKDDALAVQSAKNILRETYDKSQPFRMMTALRNYAQHHSLPVQGISFDSTLEENPSGNLFAFSVNPRLIVSALTADKHFKKAVLHEIAALGEKIDVKPLVRQFIGDIAAAHELFRERSEFIQTDWEQTIQKAILQFQTTFSVDESLGLAATLTDSRGIVENKIYLVSESQQYRDHLKAKNRFFKNLSRRYVKW